MRNTILSILLLAAAGASGCTVMCEESCESDHNIEDCDDGDTACVQETAQALLTCVQACNE